MKKLLVIFAALTLASLANAQATNPQTTFWGAEWQANPALAMSFSEPTTAFKDLVSQSTFSSNKIVNNGVIVTTSSGGNSGGTIGVNAVAFSASGTLEYIFFKANTTPTTTQTFVILSGTAPSLKIVASFTATVAATTNPQVLMAGVNFTAQTLTAGQYIGNWVATGTSVAYQSSGTNSVYFLTGQSTLPSGVQTYSSATGSYAVVGGVLTSATSTIVTQQPGFDATATGNYSAAFPYNAYNYAPNTTLSNIDWNHPWSMLLHLDNFNWDHTGTMILASKGDLQGCIYDTIFTGCSSTNSWWKLFVQLNSYSTGAQLCFMENGPGANQDQQSVCTSAGDAMPNGMNYNIIITSAGTTGTGADLKIYLNGNALLQANYSVYGNGFGNVTYAIASGGTGYANLTYFVSTGGGPNCQVTGVANATSGVITSAGTYSGNYEVNHGCTPATITATGSGTNLTVAATTGVITVGDTLTGTGVPTGTTITAQQSGTTGGAGVYTTSVATTAISASPLTRSPTIVFTSPTGTGGLVTTSVAAQTMNSSTSPLMVPGYVSNGAYYGVGGTDSSQNPVYLDEYAIFNANLTAVQIANLFYTTKFWQALVYPGLLANPPLVILEGYGCGPDLSGDQTTAMTIGAAKAGLIHLIGAIDDDGNPNGTNSVGWWRQMLDQAGFNDVPLSVGPNSPGANIGGCPAANIAAYNASTPQNASSYVSSVTMLRTLYAKYSTQPIYMLMTQAANGYNAFQLSAADSISPRTGLQLQAQNATNGGWVNAFNGNLEVDLSYYIAVLNNNGTTPVYFWGGTPADGGPGILASRTSHDPLYLANTTGSGSDHVSGWTNLNLSQVLSPWFYGGVTVTYNGGTGYANATPFTSTGGGPFCHVTGMLTASGGVPNGIETYWGYSFPSTTQYNGLGYGCTSAPIIVLTAPTGTGVTLTASPTILSSNYGGAGTNQYTIYPNQFAQPSSSVWVAPVFTWFQNSLMDPPTNGAPRSY